MWVVMIKNKTETSRFSIRTFIIRNNTTSFPGIMTKVIVTIITLQQRIVIDFNFVAFKIEISLRDINIFQILLVITLLRNLY